jgi:hypothetical protein
VLETSSPTKIVWPPSHAYASRSPYHLAEGQIRFFDQYGYLVLSHWIPPDLLQRLRAAGEALGLVLNLLPQDIARDDDSLDM